MRLVDLYYCQDVFDGTDFATLCELMTTIECGNAFSADFELLEPIDHTEIVYVSCVVVFRSDAHAWVVHKKKGKNRFFLGLGEPARDYLECVYWGAPERIRGDCFLSLNDAIPVIEQIVDGKELTSQFHWVPKETAFAPHTK
jgi:hypothetical protein